MTPKEMVAYWKKDAAEDVLTAESLFATKRYLPCLFYSHLFNEKILKALVVQATSEPSPFGHKLERLANIAKLDLSPEQRKLLNDLTAFNINARYQDYKDSLYKKATKDYTEGYLMAAKEIYLWLENKLLT